MAKKMVLGECHDLLKIMPVEQLKFFAKLRADDGDWRAFQMYVRDQKQIKMDQIYRLRRPKTQDEILRNSLEHEYYAGRIADLVMLLQIAENASDEIERRERKAK